MNIFLIFVGKLISVSSRALGRGAGSTWPGHIALSINRHFIREIIQKSSVKIIYVAGTNGKTTTGKLIQTILEKSGHKVFHNAAGANLLNGLASALIRNASVGGKLQHSFAVFEIDENTLPLAIDAYKPDYLILLNLFRDQLDRYGEINSIALKWQSSLQSLTPQTTLILNADDPQIANLGLNYSSSDPALAGESRSSRQARTIYYFGLIDKSLAQKSHQHAADSQYCPRCGTKLEYTLTYYSHVGEWQCPSCNLSRPKLDLSIPLPSSLDGIYNKYNILAATLSAKIIGIESAQVSSALQNFKPAFGRQEKLEIKGKKVQIFLAKNPASFNESLRTIAELKAKNILFVLNDRIPDGRDVSWIWDVDMEEYVEKFSSIIISGDRCYDMGLRIKYALPIQNAKFKIYENLDEAISKAMEQTQNSETLYILPTYSAMLEIRKILIGRKIL